MKHGGRIEAAIGSYEGRERKMVVHPSKRSRRLDVDRAQKDAGLRRLIGVAGCR